MIARPLPRPSLQFPRLRRLMPPGKLLPAGVLPVLAAMVLGLGGCVNSTDKTQATAVQARQLGLDQAAQVEWPDAQWWKSFEDTQLDGLIAQAVANSPSMEIASARVRQAQQAAVAARAVRDPSVALNAQVNRQRYSENYIYPDPPGGDFVTDSRVALDFSYEFDFWGGQRATIAGARQQLAAEQAERIAAELVLSISVAQSYFSLQHSAIDTALAEALVAQRQANLDLMQLRAGRGLISRGDTEAPAAQLADAQRALAASRQRGDLYRHQLAALTGQGPEALRDLQLPAAIDAIHETATAAPRQLPADLLSRRADIVAQRLRIDAAGSDIDVARAAFYPNIDLTAFAGVQSLGTSNLFESGSKMYGAGPALHLPIFNRNSLRAQFGTRLADYDLAVAQYNDRVLNAAREAADASSNLRALDLQRRAADAGLAALQRARDLAQLRHRQGLGNYLEVLAAQNSLLAQQRTVAALRDDQRQAALALIKALGGGYSQAVIAAAQ